MQKFWEMAVDSPGVMSSDFAQYDTLGKLTLRSMIPRGYFYEKFEQRGEILTKIENILTQCPMAQAGLNYEERKNRLKISLDCPFK